MKGAFLDQTLSFVVAVEVATILFPFFMAFGFFESRRNGTYVFLQKRFWGTLVFFILLNISSSFFFVFNLEKKIVDAAQTARETVLHTRTDHDYVLWNMKTVFPDQIDPRFVSCRTAAISRYVDDVWREKFKQQTCLEDQSLCSSDSYDYYRALMKKIAPYKSLPISLGAAGKILAGIWPIAGSFYKELRHISPRFVSPDDVYRPDPQAIATYKGYLDRCDSLQAPAWAKKDAPILLSAPRFCWGECLP